MATPSGLKLAWRLNVPTADQLHWYDTFQSADDGHLVYESTGLTAQLIMCSRFRSLPAE